MLNEITPDELKEIVCIVVESICKRLINEDYRLSNEDKKNVEGAIKALPHLEAIINNSESNALNSGPQKKIGAMILILFIFSLTYKSIIDQKMKYRSKPMPAVEAS